MFKLRNPKANVLLESLQLNGIISDKFIEYFWKQLLYIEINKYPELRESLTPKEEYTNGEIFNQICEYLNRFNIFSENYKSWVIAQTMAFIEDKSTWEEIQNN